MGWSSGLNKKEKAWPAAGQQQYSSLFASWLQMQWTRYLTLLLPWLPHHEGESKYTLEDTQHAVLPFYTRVRCSHYLRSFILLATWGLNSLVSTTKLFWIQALLINLFSVLPGLSGRQNTLLPLRILAHFALIFLVSALFSKASFLNLWILSISRYS